MKRLVIIILTLAVICSRVHQKIYAKIKNGYEEKLKIAETTINNLHKIANEAETSEQQQRLKKCLETARATEKILRENYMKTQNLIEKLKSIDPKLYYRIDTIKDCEGNDTYVYIKVVNDLGPGTLAVTNLNNSVRDPNVYTSYYGDNTVSVRIYYPNQKMALRLMVHELGHVAYQVPPFASYTKFYREVYQDQYFEGKKVGHIDYDPSHKSVVKTLKAFNSSWKEYRKSIETGGKK